MKNIRIKIIALLLIFSTSCGKDFLNVVPKENLSGNNYWKTQADVENFLTGIYKTFRSHTMSRIFFPATGDLRCAPTNRTSATNGSDRDYISHLKNNNLNEALNPDKYQYFGFEGITRWDKFFEMVQKANIMLYEVENMEEGIMGATAKKQYMAEAVFLRNLAYFFMVRLYGDVPYYTEAYHKDAVGRTNMVKVLDMGIADMKEYYKDLPWTYDDPSKVAVRAMRGAAITLMMHMNMWAAGFTKEDKTPYYEEVARLGQEIMDENKAAYELLPLERTKEIFQGRTKEGLFEIVQSFNYDERFHLSAPFSDYVLRFPNKLTNTTYIYYDAKFMEKLYPFSAQDKRKEIWFDEYIYDETGKMQLLKFVNIYMEEGEDFNPDDNQIVFRYADPILLRAEALAELNRDEEARTVINIIRERAGATLATNEGGEDLKDFIWWERVRELMGESQFYYDLVRTGKVINTEYTAAAMSVSAFNNGGWTWPIHPDALIDNDYMVLNNYWNQ